jgi:hypothetical protein
MISGSGAAGINHSTRASVENVLSGYAPPMGLQPSRPLPGQRPCFPFPGDGWSLWPISPAY